MQALTTWQKNTSVAIVYDNSTAYTQGADTSLVAGLQAAGVTVSANIPIIPSAINDPAVIQAAVAQALATHPTGVYADLYYPEGALVADQMLEAGTGTNCLSDYASASVGYVIDAGIPAVQNCPVLGVPAPSDFADSAPFLSAFEAEFHSAPGLWSPYTFDSVNLLVQSAIKAHNFQQVPLARALYATKRLRGLDRVGHHPVAHRQPHAVHGDGGHLRCFGHPPRRPRLGHRRGLHALGPFRPGLRELTQA